MKLSWEWATSNSGSISLHYTDGCLNALWWDSKTCANSADSGTGRGDVWESSIINVQHASISSFSNNSLLWIHDSFIHEVDGVNNHIILDHSLA